MDSSWSKQYYQDNRALILNKRAEHYIKNREEISQKNKMRYEKNRDARLLKSKEYYIANSEERKKYQQDYYQNNTDLCREKNKRLYHKRRKIKDMKLKIKTRALVKKYNDFRKNPQHYSKDFNRLCESMNLQQFVRHFR